jgi:HPt (histidine-containing phosphotransfer) domain-containing protein
LSDLGDPGEDVLGPLMKLFFEQAELHSSTISAAVRDGDAGAIGTAAHALKGAARNVGAGLIGDVAARLEARGWAGSADESALASELETAIRATATEYATDRDQQAAAGRGNPLSAAGPAQGEAA